MRPFGHRALPRNQSIPPAAEPREANAHPPLIVVANEFGKIGGGRVRFSDVAENRLTANVGRLTQDFGSMLLG